ncbi:hypothetical protein BJV74DRAFT_886816 [Russula compacta]|nr:hypothetical protein BJV74DRAFT_886816 [Russula compacta]
MSILPEILRGVLVIARLQYVNSSHRNDPGRAVLEILLALFAIISAPLLQSRARADNGERYLSRSRAILDRYQHQVEVSHGKSVGQVGSLLNTHTTAPNK